jgi:predicted dehydrogenase
MKKESEVTEKLRVGIISANWGASAHLPAWRTLDNVEVTAASWSRCNMKRGSRAPVRPASWECRMSR